MFLRCLEIRCFGCAIIIKFNSINSINLSTFQTESLFFYLHSLPIPDLSACSASRGCIFLSGAPDKFGGARVALFSLLVEIAGQLLIWAGFSGTLTILGAALTGTGMSLIFPSLGQLAVKKVAPANRGMAVAAYNAFFDLGLGLTAPLAGLIAGQSHYQNVYLFGTLAAVASTILVYREYKTNGSN